MRLPETNAKLKGSEGYAKILWELFFFEGYKIVL